VKHTIFAIGFLFLAGPASAAVLNVKADGTGGYPTIQAAVTAAVLSDIVELENGIYTGAGNRDVDLQGKAITVRSQGGSPSLCIIDCEGSSTTPHRGFQLAVGSILEGVTVRNGYDPYSGGGAVALAGATIRRCVFSGNQTPTGGSGGALEIYDGSLIQDCEFTSNRSGSGGAITADAAVVIDNCTFTGNTASEGQAVEAWACTIRNSRFVNNGNQYGRGGAITVGDGCFVEDCYFQSNRAQAGGAINLLTGSNHVTRATFVANQAEYGGACTGFYGGQGTMANCTFYGNAASSGGSVFYAEGSGDSQMNNCIAAFNLGVAPFLYGSSYRLHCACTDVFGNAGGGWFDWMDPGNAGNISLDPSFCDVQSGDFHLLDNSPCAPFNPQNPTCDLIGAWPVGCLATPTQRTSWGQLKTIFR
jgi:predicted outer membrane repeat protein